MPECRSCGKPVRWVRLLSQVTGVGKPHPLDVTPHKTIVLAGRDEVGYPLAEFVDGYTSHFATCPDAARHRKDRKRNQEPLLGEEER